MNGKNIVRLVPRTPYCKRINSTKSDGINLIARIEMLMDIIQIIVLLSPSMELFFRTVYIINMIITKSKIFAKRDSSKELIWRIVSLMNWIRMWIIC